MSEEHSNAELGPDCVVAPQVVLGYRYNDQCGPTVIGARARIRQGAIIYGDVTAGMDLSVGHYAVVRERTLIGDQVVVGTQAVIEGNVDIGSFVKIESQVFVPTDTTIGSYVFIGPNVAMTNHRYPLRKRQEYQPVGPVIEDNVSIGAGASILPGIRIKEGAMVAAGAVVTRDADPWTLVEGIPGKVRDLPEQLHEENRARSWNL